VIGVDVLWLDDFVGPGLTRLAQSVVNSLGATFDGIDVLSTRSVVLWWRLGPRFVMWRRVVNANDPYASKMKTSLRTKLTSKQWYD